MSIENELKKLTEAVTQLVAVTTESVALNREILATHQGLLTATCAAEPAPEITDAPPADSPEITREEILELDGPGLEARLEALGLSILGKNEALRNRLLKHYGFELVKPETKPAPEPEPEPEPEPTPEPEPAADAVASDERITPIREEYRDGVSRAESRSAYKEAFAALRDAYGIASATDLLESQVDKFLEELKGIKA